VNVRQGRVPTGSTKSLEFRKDFRCPSCGLEGEVFSSIKLTNTQKKVLIRRRGK